MRPLECKYMSQWSAWPRFFNMAPMRYAVAIAVAGLLVACQAPEATLQGADLYANHCSACHGAQGEGDGPVAAVMQISVPNLRSLSQRNGGEFPTDAAAAYIDGRDLPVSHGDRYMPIWGNVFGWPDEDPQTGTIEMRIQALVDHLRQIQYRSAL